MALIVIPFTCAASVLLLLVVGFRLDTPVAIALAALFLVNGLARLWLRRRL